MSQRPTAPTIGPSIGAGLQGAVVSGFERWLDLELTERYGFDDDPVVNGVDQGQEDVQERRDAGPARTGTPASSMLAMGLIAAGAALVVVALVR